MNIPVEEGSEVCGVTIRFDARGQIWKGTNDLLREHGKRYCPDCKKILPLSSFYDNPTSFCIDCERKRPSVKRATRRNSVKIMRLYNERKRNAVAALGGSCVRCGYRESVAALDFHHVKKSAKVAGIATLLGRRAVTEDDLMAELDKCALLCRNCHSALEVGEWHGRFKRRTSGIGWTLNK